MSKETAGRQYQDSVFRAYFNDVDRLRDLAGALHGRTYTTDDAVEIVTLEGTFLSQVKNDISFLLAGHHLVFIEHQSTPNENMPLRCLYYICEQLRKEIDGKQIYRNRRIPLPVPEFHVFYTGVKELPEEFIMRLSDSYQHAGDDKIHLELLVMVHNVVYRAQKALLMKSRALHDYSYFIHDIKANIAAGMKLPQAIRTAMQTCIDRDIMRNFLKEHEKEVVDMVNFEWNQDLFEAAKFEDGREQGRAEGRAEGREQGRDEERGTMILNMLREKMPLELIAKVSNLSLEKVRELGQMHSLL